MFKFINISKVLMILCILSSYELLLAADAQQQSNTGIAKVAKNITGNIKALGELVLSIAWIAGLFFFFSGAVKFKAHRDNPQQTPLAAPIVLIVVGVLLIWLPSLVTTSGETVFGESGQQGGFSGSGLTSISE